MKAKLRWYKSHKAEDKASFLRHLEGSTFVLDRLKEILQEMYEESLRETENDRSYEMASWDKYQAHHVGKRQVIREIIQLVTLTED